jgi:predicted RNase H-like HicB family nuclease
MEKSNNFYMAKVEDKILIEKERRNFSAYCPDLPGVIATGSNEEKTIENMEEAIKFHLEGIQESKQKGLTPQERKVLNESMIRHHRALDRLSRL